MVKNIFEKTTRHDLALIFRLVSYPNKHKTAPMGEHKVLERFSGDNAYFRAIKFFNKPLPEPEGATFTRSLHLYDFAGETNLVLVETKKEREKKNDDSKRSAKDLGTDVF